MTNKFFLKYYLPILLVVGLTVGAWLVGFGYIGQSPQGIDDANIFKVYARNLAEGREFVYQEGGERVEGFTSLLYMLVLSGIYGLVGELDWSVVGLSLLTLVSVVGLTVWLATWMVGEEKRRNQGFPDNNGMLIPILSRQHDGQIQLDQADWLSSRLLAMILMLIWLLLSPYFVLWIGISQMDVGLWTVLILGSVAWSAWVLAKISKNRRWWWQVMIGVGLITLLSLCRPEGMVLAGLLVGVYLLRAILGQSIRADVINFFIVLGGWLVTIIGLTTFRLSYFGYPLPNTYYAKVSPDIWYRIGQGLTYGWEWVSHNWMVGLGLLILMIVVAWSLRLIWQTRKLSLPESTLLVASWWSLVMLALSIVSGGDHFVGWRFMQPIWPLMGLVWLGFLTVIKHDWWKKMLSNWRLVIVIALLIVIMVGTQWLVIKDERYGVGHFRYEMNVPINGRLTAVRINQWFDVNNVRIKGLGRLPVVGVITAGGFAWEYQGEVFDLLGLNEVSIAHDGGQRKGLKNHSSLNAELTLAKSPDLLMPTAMSFGQMQTAGAINELLLHNTIFAKELFRNEGLRDQYRLVWLGEKRGDVVDQSKPFASDLGVLVFVRKDVLEAIRDRFMVVEVEDYYPKLQTIIKS